MAEGSGLLQRDVRRDERGEVDSIRSFRRIGSNQYSVITAGIFREHRHAPLRKARICIEIACSDCKSITSIHKFPQKQSFLIPFLFPTVDMACEMDTEYVDDLTGKTV